MKSVDNNWASLILGVIRGRRRTDRHGDHLCSAAMLHTFGLVVGVRCEWVGGVVLIIHTAIFSYAHTVGWSAMVGIRHVRPNISDVATISSDGQFAHTHTHTHTHTIATHRYVRVVILVDDGVCYGSSEPDRLVGPRDSFGR